LYGGRRAIKERFASLYRLLLAGISFLGEIVKEVIIGSMPV